MSMTLSAYVKTIRTTREVTPPGYPNDQRHVLTEEVQQLMRRVLALMPDPQTNKMCFSELKVENVMVDPWTGQPSLHQVFCTGYGDNLAKMNYASVEKIFRETIFMGELAFLPHDFQELLGLMKTEGHMASYAIQHHCSLVWAIDKKELFTRIYDYSHNILQRWWPFTWYEEVMHNLVFPEDWDILIQLNPYLAKFYNGSMYRPRGPNAGKEVLRFKRNTYSHCLEHAMDMTRMQQIYNQAELGAMMETVLPLVLHSFQVELDKRGLLRHTLLKSLFQ